MKSEVNKKSLIGIFIFSFSALSTSLTMGILASIMASYPGVPSVLVQSILIGPSLVGVVYAFFVGKINRTVPAKKLLFLSQTGMLLYGMIFLFFGGKVPVYVLIAASCLAGLNGGSCNTILGLLLANAVTDTKKRGALFGICMTLQSVGSIIITSLGGLLARERWQNAYFLFIIFAVSILLEKFLLPDVRPEGADLPAEDNKTEIVSKAGMGKVWAVSIHFMCLVFFLYIFASNNSEYVLSTYQLGGPAEAALATSMSPAGGIIAGLVIGPFVSVFKKYSAPVFCGLAAVGLALPTFVTGSLMGIYIGGFFTGFTMMGFSSYIMNALHEMVPENQYSRAMSVFSGFFNTGMLVAIYVVAFLSGLFFHSSGDVHGKFFIGTVGAVICMAASFFIYLPNKTKGRE